MKRKLFILAALLGTVAFVPSIRRAEAISECTPTYCASRPSTWVCGCPFGTPKYGTAVTCGTYGTKCGNL